MPIASGVDANATARERSRSGAAHPGHNLCPSSNSREPHVELSRASSMIRTILLVVVLSWGVAAKAADFTLAKNPLPVYYETRAPAARLQIGGRGLRLAAVARQSNGTLHAFCYDREEHVSKWISVDNGMTWTQREGELASAPDVMGAVDAGDVPDKNVNLPAYHAPTDEEIRQEVLAAKRMGFNVIRKHLFIEDHRYFDWADRLGLLVYGEPPYYWTITQTARDRWTRQVAEWVRRDRSHPSVCFWALFNAASGLEPMPLPFGGRRTRENARHTSNRPPWSKQLATWSSAWTPPAR